MSKPAPKNIMYRGAKYVRADLNRAGDLIESLGATTDTAWALLEELSNREYEKYGAALEDIGDSLTSLHRYAVRIFAKGS